MLRKIMAIALLVVIAIGAVVLYSITRPTGELAGENAVLWMKFDEFPTGFGDTDNTVYDLTSWGNDGTAVNGPVEDTGKWGKCLKFDGSNDYVEIPDDDSLDLTEMTLVAWIDIPSRDSWQAIVAKGRWEAPRNYWFGTSPASKGCVGALHIKDTAGNGHTASSDNVWAGAGLIHVVASYDGNEFRFYLNGEPDGSEIDAFTPSFNTSPLGIGARSDVGDEWKNFAKGRIDDVRIYNRALTAEEIKQIYERTASES